jgi:hypothetical protein
VFLSSFIGAYKEAESTEESVQKKSTEEKA